MFFALTMGRRASFIPRMFKEVRARFGARKEFRTAPFVEWPTTVPKGFLRVAEAAVRSKETVLMSSALASEMLAGALAVAALK